MPTDMPKAYDPRETEQRLYDWWESKGYFAPKIDPRSEGAPKPFVIVIPPPNVTGELHHGHAMFVTFEDLLIRWHRMMGEPTLWLPGSDHAGIATQNVVEKALVKQGTSRKELGREEFINRVWDWKAEYGSIITRQIRRMGASVDWTRERFTMDEQLSRAVREAFVRLYEKGLIYRGPRLVNWCPKDESAISDLEVEHEERQGNLWYVKYPIENSPNEFITVATTRPETMLGDTAVAVHPDDERYKHLIGKMALLPELNRRIPIIADESVDREFGTGAVKVTPAHDPNDYELGMKHNLPFINVMNTDATINENGGPYAGLDRYDARKKIVADLERDGLLAKVENHALSVGTCQRCHTVIEPLISTQWFVKTKPLAEPSIEAVRSGKIKIVPQRFEKIYFQWMENIRDWCISRQLWWGHRIPVWYAPDGSMFCARDAADAQQQAREKFGADVKLVQDPDVLDTWFSSGLWPFSTLGWPDDTEDLRYFYPGSVLETGYDILFFWVARMVMLGIELMGEIPFDTVYLHGIMRHTDGTKMSKSDFRAGDNPLDVIADYSADALRFFIVTSASPGNDVRINLEKIADARNFGNKIWNAARFVISNLGAEERLETGDWRLTFDESRLTLPDRWIISREHNLINRVNDLFREYRFNEAAQDIYHFLWDEYCDWYIEASKVILNGDDENAKHNTRAVLVHVLEHALRLLHPMMPFVTEEIWQHLPHKGEALIVANWPQGGKHTDAEAEAAFARIMDAVRAIRNARSEFNVEPAKRIPAILSANEHATTFETQRAVLAALARLDAAQLQINSQLDTKPENAYSALLDSGIQIYLPLAGMIDLEKEKKRIAAELDKARADAERAQAKLDSDFSTKAPEAVVNKERERLRATRERIAKLQEQLNGMN
ncbi:MAG: valine--tRNA ligase [Chloroflexi bacterium UTCFX4]|nr:MAG: valine--tRNA ligase [Chloroflexi bacterium UTCFX4]